MTSYKFEVICKNELIKELKELYREEYTIEDLHLVWFSKCLQNYKCTICDLKDNSRYYECTYNGDKKQLYVDIYDKQFNTVVEEADFKETVDKKEEK